MEHPGKSPGSAWFECRITPAGLEYKENALGPEHPSVAKAVNKLPTLYDKQGRDAESETLYKRALAIREKAVEPSDPAGACPWE